MKKRIDHERNKGLPYGQKPPVDEETRRKRSAAMKAYNRKTGLATIMGNQLAKTNRRKSDGK